MNWIEAAPAIAIAAIVLLAPGLLATWPLRMGALSRTAVSGLVSVCAYGVAGAVSGAAGLAFQAWMVLVPASVAAAIAWGVRRLVPALAVGVETPRRLPLAAMWILSTALVIGVAFWLVPDPDRISQTYDNVFHLSATAAILDGFSGSPLTLRSLIETEGGGIAFYPAGWHLLAAATAQLSGASVAVSFTAVWIAVATLAWLPGLAWLAQAILPGRAAEVALVALPLGAAFGAFPYALLAWGTIYPTFLAHALLPAAIAITIVAIRGVRAARPAGRAGAAVAGAAGVLAAIGALGIAHPRVLATWALVGVPFVAWELSAAFRRGWRRGGRPRRRAVGWLVGVAAGITAACAAGFAYAVVGLGLFDEPLADRLSGPQAAAVQTVWDGVIQVLAQMPMTGVGAETAAPAVLLAAAVVVGAGVALRRARTRWIVVAFVIVGALFALAAGSDGGFAKLATGVWYKDRFRLAAAIPVLAAPLATLGILAIARAASRSRAGAARLAAGAAVVVAATSAFVLAATGTAGAIGSVFGQPAARATDAVVSEAQEEFFADVVRREVPADQRVLGDPWDGSALTGLFAGREPVFPHVNGQWDPDRLELAWNLEWIDKDPAICDALDALRVRYVVYDPHEFGGGDPSGNHFPGPHDAVEDGLFTLVDTDGDSELYRIDQCGPLS
ncbi:DUF6541 family protein [Microbacterium karelineae]|uniref:DUF6541 family protein n=1 Tax=Microbacterium karelineae TaxID=2654283 RepID=UPI0012EABE4D|nr:DUF6541 family protein [Microbacterium karelineae]